MKIYFAGPISGLSSDEVFTNIDEPQDAFWRSWGYEVLQPMTAKATCGPRSPTKLMATTTLSAPTTPFCAGITSWSAWRYCLRRPDPRERSGCLLARWRKWPGPIT